MSWVTWEPKSTIRILSCIKAQKRRQNRAADRRRYVRRGRRAVKPTSGAECGPSCRPGRSAAAFVRLTNWLRNRDRARLLHGIAVLARAQHLEDRLYRAQLASRR